jgi:hypothetical protein
MSDGTRPRTLRPSVIEMLVLRDQMGLGRHRKTAKRDPEERALLLEMALRKIEKAERHDFVPIGFRMRRVRFPREFT